MVDFFLLVFTGIYVFVLSYNIEFRAIKLYNMYMWVIDVF